MRTMAIMQPYLFPYLGYWALMNEADEFMLFDPVQYIRKGWMNRNRVLKNGGGIKYVGLTVNKSPRETLIKEIVVSDLSEQTKSLIRNLDYYRTKAPHYNSVVELVRQSLNTSSTLLSEIILHSLRAVNDYVGLGTKFSIYSHENIIHPEPHLPGDWALYITKALGVERYINPPGGKEIFDTLRFKEAGIELVYLQPELRAYDQRKPQFEPGLSILDVLMFNTPTEAKELICSYQLERAW